MSDIERRAQQIRTENAARTSGRQEVNEIEQSSRDNAAQFIAAMLSRKEPPISLYTVENQLVTRRFRADQRLHTFNHLGDGWTVVWQDIDGHICNRIILPNTDIHTYRTPQTNELDAARQIDVREPFIIDTGTTPMAFPFAEGLDILAGIVEQTDRRNGK